MLLSRRGYAQPAAVVHTNVEQDTLDTFHCVSILCCDICPTIIFRYGLEVSPAAFSPAFLQHSSGTKSASPSLPFDRQGCIAQQPFHPREQVGTFSPSHPFSPYRDRQRIFSGKTLHQPPNARPQIQCASQGREARQNPEKKQERKGKKEQTSKKPSLPPFLSCSATTSETEQGNVSILSDRETPPQILVLICG